jgi:hypothetical protein
VTPIIHTTGELTGSVLIRDTQPGARQLKFSPGRRLSTSDYTGWPTCRPATSGPAALLMLERDDGSTARAAVKALLQ